MQHDRDFNGQLFLGTQARDHLQALCNTTNHQAQPATVARQWLSRCSGHPTAQAQLISTATSNRRTMNGMHSASVCLEHGPRWVWKQPPGSRVAPSVQDGLVGNGVMVASMRQTGRKHGGIENEGGPPCAHTNPDHNSPTWHKTQPMLCTTRDPHTRANSHETLHVTVGQFAGDALYSPTCKTSCRLLYVSCSLEISTPRLPNRLT